MEVNQHSTVDTHHDDHAHDHAHGHHHDHDHDEGNFFSKYIFTTDHKMISKQFLITAIFMACLAMGMALIFRLQLAWPDTKFPFLEDIIGRWGNDGKLEPGFEM